MEYDYANSTLDSILDVAYKLDQAKKEVNEKFGEGINCSIYNKHSINSFNVIFSLGKIENSKLQEYVNDFFHIAGVPDFVGGNYKIIETALQPYNKVLQRKFSGMLFGKHVVDK